MDRWNIRGYFSPAALHSVAPQKLVYRVYVEIPKDWDAEEKEDAGLQKWISQ